MFKLKRTPPTPNPYGLEPESIFDTFYLFRLPLIRHALFLIRLICWIAYDIFMAIKNRNKKVHLYGIWCFVGLPGAGKTMSLVRYLDQQRREHGDKIKIITNFYYAGEDEHLSNYELFLKEYDRPVIFAWDELQNEFNSREYRKFPMQLVHEMTQNRKGHGKQLVYTTQSYTAVDKNFRNLTTKVIDCRTYFRRLTSCRVFKTAFYEAFMASSSLDKKIKIKPEKRERFLQTNYLRGRYDSFQRLDYLKGLDYVGLQQQPEEE